MAFIRLNSFIKTAHGKASMMLSERRSHELIGLPINGSWVRLAIVRLANLKRAFVGKTLIVLQHDSNKTASEFGGLIIV